MALRHVRAAQKRSISDPIAKSILQVIATDIGHDDGAAFPSYRTIAERAGCHFNTVGDKVRELEGAGHLSIEKKGRRNYYNLPFDCNSDVTQPPHAEGYKKEGVVTSSVTEEGELLQRIDNLCDKVESLSQEVAILSQKLSHFVTPKDVTEVEDNVSNTPPNPPRGANGREVDFARRFNPDTTAVLEHLVEQFGISPPKKHEITTWSEWLADLDKLLGIGGDARATCDLLDRVAEYMDENGLSYVRPASFVKIARRMASEPKSRYSREAQQAWDKMLRHVKQLGTGSYARWPDLSEEDKRAIRAVGGKPALGESNPDKYKKDFLAAWDGQHG